MFRYSVQNIVLAAVLSLTALAVSAQKVKEPKTTGEWTAAYQPFRIAGNLYYVGTNDLASVLTKITSFSVSRHL